MKAHWMVWVWKRKHSIWCKSYTMTLTFTKSQPSWTPMGPTCKRALSLSQTQVTSFWENGVHPSRTVPETCRLYAKVHWNCSGDLCWFHIRNSVEIRIAGDNLSRFSLKHLNVLQSFRLNLTVRMFWHSWHFEDPNNNMSQSCSGFRSSKVTCGCFYKASRMNY